MAAAFGSDIVKTASVADLTATGNILPSIKARSESVNPVPFILTRRVAGAPSASSSYVITSTSETLRNAGLGTASDSMVSTLSGSAFFDTSVTLIVSSVGASNSTVRREGDL